MPTISKDHFSASTDGKPIAIGINSDANNFTAVHTGPTNTAHFHEVWLWVNNANGSTNEQVTVRFNGANNNGKIKVIVPPQETLLVLPGIPIQGNASAVAIDIGGSSANSANCFGYINKIE